MLWLDALSFVLSAAIVLITVPLTRARAAASPSKRYFDELKLGIQFIFHDRLTAQFGMGATLILIGVWVARQRWPGNL